MEKKAVWFSVFRRVVPADYEEWLEKMALQGWNVEKIRQFDSFRMVFHKSEPRRYRYVFDLNAFPKADYRNTYEQFGWEFVGQMASCFVWRKTYTDIRPESFSDTESLVKRNKRVKNAVTAALILFLLGIAVLMAGIVVCGLRGLCEQVMELAFEAFLLAFIAGYLWWVTRQIRKNLER